MSHISYSYICFVSFEMLHQTKSSTIKYWDAIMLTTQSRGCKKYKLSRSHCHFSLLFNGRYGRACTNQAFGSLKIIVVCRCTSTIYRFNKCKRWNKVALKSLAKDVILLVVNVTSCVIYLHAFNTTLDGLCICIHFTT